LPGAVVGLKRHIALFSRSHERQLLV